MVMISSVGGPRYDLVAKLEYYLERLDNGSAIVFLLVIGEVSIWHQVRVCLADIIPPRSIGPSSLEALACPVAVVVFRESLD